MVEKDDHHLLQVRQKHYEISEYWKGENVSGIEMEWKYSPKHNDRTLHLSIQGYILNNTYPIWPQAPVKPQL